MKPELTYAGCAFPANRQGISTVLAELERQRKDRWDLTLNSKNLEFKLLDNQLLLKITTMDRSELVPVTRTVYSQMAGYLGIRMSDRFYQWLCEHPQSYANTVNDYLHTKREQRMVRCLKNLDGQLYCRAFLSDKYYIIPNADFFYAVFDALKSSKAEIWNARLSEDRFFLYAVAPGISGEVRTDRAFDPGDGWQSRWVGSEGDVLHAALAASNSETGEGGCSIAQAILRRVCINYCVLQNVLSKTHIGKRQESDVILSEDTIRHRNAYFFGQISDAVDNTFNPVVFEKFMNTINEATQDTIEDAEAATNALQLVYNISEERKNKIRNLFLIEHDFSRYGLSNSITNYAYSQEPNPEIGYQFEELGSTVLQTPMSTIVKKALALKALKNVNVAEVEELLAV